MQGSNYISGSCRPFSTCRCVHVSFTKGCDEFSVATLGQIVFPSALSGNKTFSSVTATNITSILICLFLRFSSSSLPTLRGVYEFIYRLFITFTLLGLLCSTCFRVFSPCYSSSSSSSSWCTCSSAPSILISSEEYELSLFRSSYQRCEAKNRKISEI